jgi:hypothetical protein
MSLNDKICVIAANNSYTGDDRLLDYLQLASIAAERVKYYLGLPTYLITSDVDAAKEYTIFAGYIKGIPTIVNKRNVIAGDSTIQYAWKNDARIDAFNLTKGLANKVLMIDADYMVASDQLSVHLKNDSPFWMFTKALDVTGSGIYLNNYFPSNDIHQRWATAMCWDHSTEAEVIFETAKMVRDNYEFYALMLGMPRAPFRNDVAFSIASHLHNIPLTSTQRLWNLPPAGHVVHKERSNSWLVSFGEKVFTWHNDIHILNKMYAIDSFLMDQLRLKNVKA